jgi:hypothetical protein
MSEQSKQSEPGKSAKVAGGSRGGTVTGAPIAVLAAIPSTRNRCSNSKVPQFSSSV